MAIFFAFTGNPRNKCALKPGHSLMDWVRLGSSNCDLAGTKGVIRPVSYEELAKHNKKDDAWLAIRGKVFNVTQYMDFHPGGNFFLFISKRNSHYSFPFGVFFEINKALKI